MTDCGPNKKGKISVEVPILGARHKNGSSFHLRKTLHTVVRSSLAHDTVQGFRTALRHLAPPLTFSTLGLPYLQLSAHLQRTSALVHALQRGQKMRFSDALTWWPSACGSLVTFC
jgi:hypothetical protein